MKICLTGGRKYDNAEHIEHVINCFDGMGTAWGVGDCPTGLDDIAKDYFKTCGSRMYIYTADWKKYGKSAGPVRNERMLKDFYPDVVLAFKGGNGTEDCVRRAKALGIPVLRVEEPA